MKFKQDMHEGMRGEGYNFADVVSNVRAECEKNFLEAAKEALVEETDWTYEDEYALLKDEMKSVADQCRKDETKKMINAIEVFPIFPLHAMSLNWPLSAHLQEADLRTCRSAPQQTCSGNVGQCPAELQGNTGEGRSIIPRKGHE